MQVAEQLSGVGCVVWLLGRVPENDLERACAAISRGMVTADLVSLLLVAGLYLLFRLRGRTLPGGLGRGSPERRPISSGSLTRRMLGLALPLALSAYARTGLSALENLLVPQKLRAAGFSADSALGGYGTISGMVLPMIAFPACVLNAVAELTVPELTAAQVRGDARRIRRLVLRLLGLALGYALTVSLLFLSCAEPLGMLVYRTPGVGHYLRRFTLLIPFLYIDIITDGCLKGLGQMLWSMVFNVAESLIGVLLVAALLPVRGLEGYIFVLFFCEIFNFSLSLLRLRQTVGGGAAGKERRQVRFSSASTETAGCPPASAPARPAWSSRRGPSRSPSAPERQSAPRRAAGKAGLRRY